MTVEHHHHDYPGPGVPLAVHLWEAHGCDTEGVLYSVMPARHLQHHLSDDDDGAELAARRLERPFHVFPEHEADT